MLLKEGERLVIGGVTQTVRLEHDRKVPVLGDIPFLGLGLQAAGDFEQGRELVVFLTPSIVRRDCHQRGARRAPRTPASEPRLPPPEPGARRG